MTDKLYFFKALHTIRIKVLRFFNTVSNILSSHITQYIIHYSPCSSPSLVLPLDKNLLELCSLVFVFMYTVIAFTVLMSGSLRGKALPNTHLECTLYNLHCNQVKCLDITTNRHRHLIGISS